MVVVPAKKKKEEKVQRMAARNARSRFFHMGKEGEALYIAGSGKRRQQRVARCTVKRTGVWLDLTPLYICHSPKEAGWKSGPSFLHDLTSLCLQSFMASQWLDMSWAGGGGGGG